MQTHIHMHSMRGFLHMKLYGELRCGIWEFYASVNKIYNLIRMFVIVVRHCFCFCFFSCWVFRYCCYLYRYFAYFLCADLLHFFSLSLLLCMAKYVCVVCVFSPLKASMRTQNFYGNVVKGECKNFNIIFTLFCCPLNWNLNTVSVFVFVFHVYGLVSICCFVSACYPKELLC